MPRILPKIPHARWKGSGLAFRRKVPLDLRSRVGRTEIIRALKSASVSQARLWTRSLWLSTERVFRMLRENPNVTKEQIDSIIASVRADCEYADEVRLADSGALFHHSGAAPRDADALVLEAHAQEYRHDLAHNQIDRVRDDVVRRASAAGLKIEMGSLDERLIGRAILKEFIRSCEKAAADSRSQLAYMYPDADTCSDLADTKELPPQVASPPENVRVETKHISVRPTLPIAESSPPKETVEQNPRLAKLSQQGLP